MMGNLPSPKGLLRLSKNLGWYWRGAPLQLSNRNQRRVRWFRNPCAARDSYMAVWAKYLEADFFGNELLAGKSTKIEWLKPVYADDVLTGKATIIRKEKRNARNGVVEVSITAWNQHGEVVLTDATEAIVKRRPV